MTVFPTSSLSVFAFLPLLAFAEVPSFSPHDFAIVRDRFLEIYSPTVKNESNLGLEIYLDTDSPEYFGGVDIREGKLTIVMGSEFDRQPKVTPDLYALVLCHEVAHLLPRRFVERLGKDSNKLSGRSGVVVNLNKATVDGRMDITEIGGTQLISLINILDPN